MLRHNVRQSRIEWSKRQLQIYQANFDAEMEVEVENGGDDRTSLYYNISVSWEVDSTGSLRVPSA